MFCILASAFRSKGGLIDSSELSSAVYGILNAVTKVHEAFLGYCADGAYGALSNMISLSLQYGKSEAEANGPNIGLASLLAASTLPYVHRYYVLDCTSKKGSCVMPSCPPHSSARSNLNLISVMLGCIHAF